MPVRIGQIDGIIPVSLPVSTISTTITRPADSNAYAANDALSDSTSIPSLFVLSGMAKVPGGSGIIRDAVFSTSASSALQGELWMFDVPAAVVNDNAAFTVTDAQILNLVGIIPFNCSDTTAVNAVSYVTGLDIGYTCLAGDKNLYFLVKVMAVVTPASAEVLSIRLKVNN